TSPHFGEDELGARLPGPIEDEIDRRSTTAADKDDGLIDDVCVVRPTFFEAMAVDTRGRRPRRARLQREAVSERQPDEVGQPAIWLRFRATRKAVALSALPLTLRRRTRGSARRADPVGEPPPAASRAPRAVD